MVKSVVNGVVTYYVGAHPFAVLRAGYEISAGAVTKYYYAGAQRIATLAPALQVQV
jgi:hypothetical protein